MSTIYDKGESALSNEVTVIGTSGIEDVKTLSMVFASNNTLYIKNAEGKNVTVSAVNGINFYQGVADNNMIAVSLEDGVYVVTIDGTTTKVVVK